MNFYDKDPQILDRKPSKLREHLGRGMTAFLVIVAGVLFFFALFRLDAIMEGFEKVYKILAPVISGLVIAFLLNPLMKRIEKLLIRGLSKISKKEKVVMRTARVIAIALSLLVLLAIIIALFSILIPELYNSIRDLVLTLPTYISSGVEHVNEMVQADTKAGRFMADALLQGGDALEKWVKSINLLEQTNVLMAGLTTGIISVVDTVMDLLIGLIVAAYVLFSKEKFMNQGKKIVYALAKPKRANLILHIGKKANSIFGGFLIGKIIDSAIIGVLCFIGVSILRMPYTLLVSVIVGVTNVIPFFGPFIGAIPSAILILLVDPIKGIYFIIFVLVLQQLDGNVIGPKILGDSTGLSAFWVIVAILVGGGLFGVTGMIIGVPTFALLYYIVKMFINQKLRQKNLPTDTGCYAQQNFVNENGEFVFKNAEEVVQATLTGEKEEE